MKILQSIFPILVLLILLGRAHGDSSEEEEDEEQDQEAEDNSLEDSEQGDKPQSEAAQSQQVSNSYIQDPFLFYKWPGVGQQEGITGRFPWWPLIPYQLVNGEDLASLNLENKTQGDLDEMDDLQDSHHYDKGHKDKKNKKKKKKKKDESDESEEDDPLRVKYNSRYKKKQIEVLEVGSGKFYPKGKSTPWGVIHAGVARLEEPEEEVEKEVVAGPSSESEELYPYPYHGNRPLPLSRSEDVPHYTRRLAHLPPDFQQRADYKYIPGGNSLEEENSGDNSQVWIRSYGQRPIDGDEWKKK